MLQKRSSRLGAIEKGGNNRTIGQLSPPGSLIVVRFSYKTLISANLRAVRWLMLPPLLALEDRASSPTSYFHSLIFAVVLLATCNRETPERDEQKTHHAGACTRERERERDPPCRIIICTGSFFTLHICSSAAQGKPLGFFRKNFYSFFHREYAARTFVGVFWTTAKCVSLKVSGLLRIRRRKGNTTNTSYFLAAFLSPALLF